LVIEMEGCEEYTASDFICLIIYFLFVCLFTGSDEIPTDR
jgi:hypothetical protein